MNSSRFERKSAHGYCRGCIHDKCLLQSKTHQKLVIDRQNAKRIVRCPTPRRCRTPGARNGVRLYNVGLLAYKLGRHRPRLARLFAGKKYRNAIPYHHPQPRPRLVALHRHPYSSVLSHRHVVQHLGLACKEQRNYRVIPVLDDLVALFPDAAVAFYFGCRHLHGAWQTNSCTICR